MAQRKLETEMYKSDLRITYQQLKASALEDYFNFCRDSGLIDRRPHEQILARLAYSFEDGFERPIENLMWRVILFILSGGWHRDWEARTRVNLLDDIAHIDLAEILANLPTQESEMFLHDLRILKLIKK